MYRVPKDLELSSIIGESTTYFCVGRYNLSFRFGTVTFSVESEIDIKKDGKIVGRWIEKTWPGEEFLDVINVDVVGYSIPDDRTIAIQFENGLELHLHDNSDQYESFQIAIDGKAEWVI